MNQQVVGCPCAQALNTLGMSDLFPFLPCIREVRIIQSFCCEEIQAKDVREQLHGGPETNDVTSTVALYNHDLSATGGSSCRGRLRRDWEDWLPGSGQLARQAPGEAGGSSSTNQAVTQLLGEPGCCEAVCNLCTALPDPPGGVFPGTPRGRILESSTREALLPLCEVLDGLLERDDFKVAAMSASDVPDKLPIPMVINMEIKEQLKKEIREFGGQHEKILKLLEGVQGPPELQRKFVVYAMKQAVREQRQALIGHLQKVLDKIELDHFLKKDIHTDNL
ncbi:uncharacterized protein LOC144308221 [Canis aureus]